MLRFWGIRLASIALAIGACFLLQSKAVHSTMSAILGLGSADFAARLLMLAGLYVTLAVSLNLINGITGQFSIGHAAFYQVGAYAAGFVSLNYYQKSGLQGVPWLIAMVLFGAVAAALAGLVVGLPSLRLKGDYLAIVTLGFGEIIRIIVQNTASMGGSYGMKVQPKFQMIWLVWLLAVVCIAVCRNLLKTAHGLQFLAVREDEVASNAMGVHVTGVKVAAFVIGSAFAGAAGALLAHYEGFINPGMFPMDLSFIVLTMVVLGGTGSITGSAVAAVFLFLLPEKMRDLPPIAGNSLVAWVLAIVLAIVLLKKIEDHYHGPKLRKAGLYVAMLALAGVAQLVLAAALGRIGSLAEASFEADKLRMVIFAATLIVLMLLRPQGVFAHHEFSWSWVKTLFGRRTPKTAVSA